MLLFAISATFDLFWRTFNGVSTFLLLFVQHIFNVFELLHLNVLIDYAEYGNIRLCVLVSLQIDGLCI